MRLLTSRLETLAAADFKSWKIGVSNLSETRVYLVINKNHSDTRVIKFLFEKLSDNIFKFSFFVV